MVVIRKIRGPRKGVYKPRVHNVSKVNDIDPMKYSRFSFDYSPAKYLPSKKIEILINNYSYYQDLYCTFFGCGRRLNFREKLFGNTCITHNGIETDITNHLSI